MPQETKARPFDVEQATANGIGVIHENLEGWIPSLATDDEIRSAFEKALDFRGDITLTLKDGRNVRNQLPCKNQAMLYGVIIEPDEDGQFVAECPALPGCISQGKTREPPLDLRFPWAAHQAHCQAR